jgi:energy-coupling factor transport system ATP-binding protein
LNHSLLEAEGLEFSYTDSTNVLRSANISIPKGNLVLLTGPTGSGKSTLALCLSGLIPHSIPGELTGRIEIDGVDISSLSMPEISRRVAMVQQDTEGQVATLQVQDEVAFGPENFAIPETEILTRIDDSLEAVNCEHLRNRSTNALSGGEKQRVVIASLLACKPDYLILDEPTSNLDPCGVSELQTIIEDLKERDIGILCIEHKIGSLVQQSDQILEIRDGQTQAHHFHKMEHETEIPRQSAEIHKTAILSIEDVSFSYGSRLAIDGISLDSYPGEIIAVMGNNGSGKTTLLSLAAGLLEPDSGVSYLDGKPVSELTPSQIASLIGFVFQNPNHQIFEKTVWAEQTLVADLLPVDRQSFFEKARALLSEASLISMRERNPFTLSHGQKRRLNITSVTAHEPRILLLDEPFVGQDTDGQEFITRTILNKAKHGGTCLLITHNSLFAQRYCNRVLFLQEGNLLLDGPPEMVFNRLEQLGLNEYVPRGEKR